MNVREKWVPPAREFQKNSPKPTFKKPLKPPLLLFELFVQSESAMLMGPRAACRHSDYRVRMFAFGGKADIEDSLPPRCVFGSWLMVSCRARASADEVKSFNDRLLDQLPFDTG